MKKWRKPSYVAQSISLKFCQTEKLRKNCLQEADTCCSSLPENRPSNKKQRADILFALYPKLKKAYGLCHSFKMILAKNTVKDAAKLSMAKRYNKVEKAGFHSFNVIAATFYEYHNDILNFYNNRTSNAAAKSFNAKKQNLQDKH